jgi:hypothetical protein
MFDQVKDLADRLIIELERVRRPWWHRLISQ